MTVSVILPCFNEGVRILPVVDQVKKSRNVTEIIIVDDGSDSATRSLLKTITDIKLIRHPNNQGKSQAMKTGVLASTGEVVAFIDSDLTGFKYQHLDKLIKPVISGQVDICLSERDREFFRIFDEGFVIAFTGERALRRELMVKHLDIFLNPGYLAEAAFNNRFFNQDYRVGRVKFDQVSHYPKHQKQGHIVGLFKDIRMCLNILSFLGAKTLLHQVRFSKSIPVIS